MDDPPNEMPPLPGPAGDAVEGASSGAFSSSNMDDRGGDTTSLAPIAVYGAGQSTLRLILELMSYSQQPLDCRCAVEGGCDVRRLCPGPGGLAGVDLSGCFTLSTADIARCLGWPNVVETLDEVLEGRPDLLFSLYLKLSKSNQHMIVNLLHQHAQKHS